nr:reverse transcriptase domain-containing protein [Tanacetum cinerariifolium]
MNERNHFHHGNNKKPTRCRTSRREASETNKGRNESKTDSLSSQKHQRDPGFRQRKVQASSANENPSRKKNHSKFCEFHEEVGHTTDECMHPERQIEEMIKHVAKQRITQTFSSETVISFPPLGGEDGTEGPMIIEAEMKGHFIHRISQMVPAAMPLVGFSREVIWPLGQISLLVKIGDKEHSTFTWMNFMVVRSPSPYNGIIGRQGVRRIQAVSSMAHGMLKFPVTCGTVMLWSSRIIPLECTMVLGPGAQQPVIDQVTEEKIQVATHPEYPEQTIAIGFTLMEEGRKELCSMLRNNLHIFA